MAAEVRKNGKYEVCLRKGRLDLMKLSSGEEGAKVVKEKCSSQFPETGRGSAILCVELTRNFLIFGTEDGGLLYHYLDDCGAPCLANEYSHCNGGITRWDENFPTFVVCLAWLGCGQTVVGLVCCLKMIITSFTSTTLSMLRQFLFLEMLEKWTSHSGILAMRLSLCYQSYVKFLSTSILQSTSKVQGWLLYKHQKYLLACILCHCKIVCLSVRRMEHWRLFHYQHIVG